MNDYVKGGPDPFVGYFELVPGRDLGKEFSPGQEVEVLVADGWYRAMFVGAALGAVYAVPMVPGLREGDMISDIRAVEVS